MTDRKTKYVILGLLAEGPLTGYEIKQRIDLRFRFFWSESYGQLYPELKHLTRLDWLTATDVAPDARSPGAARRRVRYAITEAGREALHRWLSEPVEKESIRLELLLKMYFSRETVPQTMQAHLHAFIRSHREQLLLLDRFHEELARIPDPDGNHGDILQVIEFGRMSNTAYLAWAEQAMDYLSHRATKGCSK